jgi:hypothetical protein
MKLDLVIFLVGVVITILGTLGFLVMYAAAAADEAEYENDALARLTLRVCAMIGFAAPHDEQKPPREAGESAEPAESGPGQGGAGLK